MNALSVAAEGLVISTNAVPSDVPMIAYSRPAGEMYPQHELPLVLAAESVFSGNHDLS